MTTPNRRALTLAICFLAMGTASLWIAEDALIPLRVVQQFWAGNGLVWNPDERVQVCTSLAWQMLILPCGLFGNMPLALGLICVAATAGIGFLIGKKCQHPWTAAMLATAWLASWSTREFMVSGLETPLVAILLGMMIHQYFKNPTSRSAMIWLGMVPLARLDLAIIALPFAAITAWELRKDIQTLIRRGALAAILVTVQCLLSFWYFGSIFPNTYYAKKFTGEEPDRTIQVAVDYLNFSFSSDWVLWTLPIFAIVLLCYQGGRGKLAAAGAIGMLSYTLYAATTNDYMVCRFLVPNVLVAIAILAHLRISKTTAMVATASLVAMFFTYEKKTTHQYITDERGTRFGAIHTDLLKPSFYQLHGFRNQTEESPLHNGCIGVLGITSPTGTYIVDHNRLGQPLLARLPATYAPKFAPGHYWTDAKNVIPPVYWQTRDPNTIDHPEVRKLAELVKAAASDSVFSLERIPKLIELATFKLKPETTFNLRYDNPPEVGLGQVKHIPQGGVTLTAQNLSKLKLETNAPVRIRFLKNFEDVAPAQMFRNGTAIIYPPKGTTVIHIAAINPVSTTIKLEETP